MAGLQHAALVDVPIVRTMGRKATESVVAVCLLLHRVAIAGGQTSVALADVPIAKMMDRKATESAVAVDRLLHRVEIVVGQRIVALVDVLIAKMMDRRATDHVVVVVLRRVLAPQAPHAIGIAVVVLVVVVMQFNVQILDAASHGERPSACPTVQLRGASAIPPARLFTQQPLLVTRSGKEVLGVGSAICSALLLVER